MTFGKRFRDVRQRLCNRQAGEAHQGLDIPLTAFADGETALRHGFQVSGMFGKMADQDQWPAVPPDAVGKQGTEGESRVLPGLGGQSSPEPAGQQLPGRSYGIGFASVGHLLFGLRCGISRLFSGLFMG